MALDRFYDIGVQRPSRPCCDTQPLGHLLFCLPCLFDSF
jgi:hypothetical protein